MSEQKPEGMIDFSNYEGDYQEGELLGEDGQAIDMEDLKGDKPPRAPMLIKVVFLVACLALGGGGYWAFILKAPPPPPPPRPATVKRNKTLDKTLEKLTQIRSTEFFPLARCWDVLLRGQVKDLTLDQGTLVKACPPLKAGAINYQPSCADNCQKVLLSRCQGASCQPVEQIEYIDFLQMVMVRVADGHNRLMSLLRAYEHTLEQEKKATTTKQGVQEAAANANEVKTQIEDLFAGKGQNPASWGSSYLSLAPDTLYRQAIEKVKSFGAVPAAKEDDAPKKRRRKRRKAKKADDSNGKALWGGKLIASAKWPIAGLAYSSYRSIDAFRVEPYGGGIPFSLEKRADELSAKSAFNYSPATVNFWTFLLLQTNAQLCASTHAKQTTYSVDFKAKVNSKLGRFYVDSIQVSSTPPNPKVADCIATPVRKNRLEFGYRGLPEKPEIHNLHVVFELTP